MAGDPSNIEPSVAEKRLVAGFVEEVGAEAVLVIWSNTKKRHTASRITSWGNHFAVKGMLEWAFDTIVGFDPVEDDEDEDEEDVLE
tara:strand:- start:5660 stop:5917 length:258 start_codon:yes stop_codon:yes gene_type:complete